MKKSAVEPGTTEPWASVFFKVCAGLVLLLIVTDTNHEASVLWKATNLKLSEAEIGAMPVASGARERRLVLPVSGIDGKWWVMHTEQMIREGNLRVRETRGDNPPDGREIHWSSGLMWLLAAMAYILHSFSQTPVLDCVPIAAMYAGPILLTILLGIYAFVLKRRYGWEAAAVGIIFFATCFPIFQMFRTGNCDHHGLVGWFATMTLLCLAAGGGGLRDAKAKKATEKTSRQWFIAAGILGAAGLWVSAATQIPILAGASLAAVLTGWLARRDNSVRLAPGLWRVWGASGCVASLAFYVIEYFPFHMGWRLEINHPLYALAWLAGGDLLARLNEGFEAPAVLPKVLKDLPGLLLSLAILILPGIVILVFKNDVFWVSDRFLLALHNEHIGEFQPFFKAIAGPAQGIVFLQAMLIPIVCVATLIFLIPPRRLPAACWGPLLVVIVPALVMLTLGMRQVRWVGISLCLWSLLATLLVTFLRGGGLLMALRRWQVAALTIFAFATVSISPYIWWRGLISSPKAANRIEKNLIPNVVARDVIQRILRADPSRLPVILSGPTTSTDIAFYGGTPVIGTLYWENMPGLKAAADIFSAPTADIAKARLLSHKVTHILLFSWDEFSKDYSQLWGREIGSQETNKMFVTRLVEGDEMPQWVRPLSYPIPEAFEMPSESVSLFEILPHQTRIDSLVAQTNFRIDAGQFDKALALLAMARSEYPTDPRIEELEKTATEAEEKSQK